MSDTKTNPAHYQLDPSPIDVVEKWGLGFCLGNCIKYIARAGRKPGETAVEDLRKARWHLSREIERLEKEAAK